MRYNSRDFHRGLEVVEEEQLVGSQYDFSCHLLLNPDHPSDLPKIKFGYTCLGYT